MGTQPILSVVEAKKILGTTAKGLTDEAILGLIMQVDILTDVVIGYVKISEIQSAIDVSKKTLHNYI